MIWVALAFVLLLIVFGGFIAFTLGLVRLVLFLVVAGLVGWVADAIVPGELPFGWLGAITAGLLGSWLGTILIGPIGPSLLGIRILPALLGAIILAFIADLVLKKAAPTQVR